MNASAKAPAKAPTKAPAIIGARELVELTATGDVVILDCRYDLADPDAGARAFSGGHIPGARHAGLHPDLSDPTGRYGGRHPLPSPVEFEKFARHCGIDGSTTVVVYDDNRLVFAARAWFLFHYFGHDNIAVLNGGLSAWRGAGLPLANEENTATKTGNFTGTARPELLLEYERIHGALENPPWQLVDAREARRFAGQEEPIDPVAGHIPSAINKPWQEVTNDDGTLKTRAELEAHWQDVPADEYLVNYCGSGVSACVNLLSQHLIGRDDALLYPGSWSDWCAHMLLPDTSRPHEPV